MGLRDLFADGVASIFSALDDIPVEVTYKSRTESYDPVTRIVTLASASLDVDAILDEYSAVELRFSERLNEDQTILGTDKKAMIKADDLSSITPKVLDTITIDGTAWQVKAMKVDPAGAMWTFQIRRP